MNPRAPVVRPVLGFSGAAVSLARGQDGDATATGSVGVGRRGDERVRALLVRPPRWFLLVVAALGVVSVLASVRLAWVQELRGSWVDVAVYREAVIAWWSGQPLYSGLHTSNRLGFTYPPFAVLPLGWLGLLDASGAARVMIVANAAALVGTCRVALGAALRAPGRRWPVASPGAVWAVALGVAGVAVWLEPVRVTIGYGQVNLLLALMVLVDCLLVPPRWRGYLTGIAASVKLTPAVFLLLFGVTGQRGAALRTVASAAAATVAAVVLAPGSSWRFWTSTVWSNTTGRPWFTANQSLRGVSERLLHGGGAVGPTTALATVVVLVVGAVAIRRCWLAGWQVSAVSTTGVVGLLVSPVSWSHHWVWVVPLVLGLALEIRTRRSRQLAWTVVVVTSVAAHWFLPQWSDRELGWAWWMNVVGNLYGYVGVAVLVVVAGAGRARPAPRHWRGRDRRGRDWDGRDWDVREVEHSVDRGVCPRQESNLRPSD